ncbi:MAG: gliding motility-associated C-terminal domain-containing protein [Bacteroidales bacterium]|nr:gliding motility-associated C-terminal domain-containing protein [Bacteroidales bacterium]
MRKILLIIVFFLGINISFGQKPNILCTQVNEDGGVTIFYQTVSNDFIQYSFSFFNSSLGDYELVGSESDINVSSFTDNSRDANSEQIKYRLSSNPTNISYGNTIFLSLIYNGGSSFRLDWTSPHPSPSENLTGTENQKYIIYRRFANQSNSWQKIDSTTLLTFTDNFPPPCSDTVYYKVELPNAYGCSSVSNLRSHFVEDIEIPSEAIVLCSGVDLDSQKLVLSWTPSPSIDTKGYVICEGSPCVGIDTIMGANQNSFICDTCNVEYVFSLAVMAFDSCYNTSIKSNNHKNIVLSYTREACSNVINLSWTKYVGDPLNVIVYNLYLSQNGGAYNLHQTFTASDSTFTFNANPVIENHSFYIEAILSNTKTSKSNIITTTQGLPAKVDYAYIRKASVSDDNTKIELDFFVDASLVVRGYDLYRSVDNIDFFIIKTIDYSGNNSFSYTDTPPTSANKATYYYKLMVPDECNLLYTSSNTFSTTRLLVDASDAEMNVLTWNELKGWESVESYDIYRIDENSPFGLQLSNVLSAEMGFEDNTSSMVTASDKIEYYIIANEGGSYPDGKKSESRSSTAEVIKESLIFVPNSFSPTNIVNNEFKPVCSFIRTGTYVLRIMSRWGEVMFESKDLNKGWDGYFKGKICSAQSYIYIIEFVNSEGKKIKKSGIVNLIN